MDSGKDSTTSTLDEAASLLTSTCLPWKERCKEEGLAYQPFEVSGDMAPISFDGPGLPPDSMVIPPDGVKHQLGKEILRMGFPALVHQQRGS